MNDNKKKNIFSKEDLYFTSDTHFFHENVIKFCDRPFQDVREMNKVLMDNWNAKVSPEAHIFLLGDFMLKGSIDMARHMLSRLNGKKYLIMGNHDYQNKMNRQSVIDLFESVHDYLYIHVQDEDMKGHEKAIFLCHYPMLSWNGSVRGSWQLFGHVHSGPRSTSVELPLLKNLSPAQYDVGVDNNDFTPVSYEELKHIISKQYLNK